MGLTFIVVPEQPEAGFGNVGFARSVGFMVFGVGVACIGTILAKTKKPGGDGTRPG